MKKGLYMKIFTMYGASVLSIALGFFISIFNSRVLGPENFGDYKFIETVARFIASLVSVGFFISITRLLAVNENITKKRRFLGLFVAILSVTSVIGMVLFLGFSFVEPYFFDNDLGPTIRTYFFVVIVILGQLALAEILKGLHQIYTISFLSVVPPLLYLIIIYIVDELSVVKTGTVLLCYYG